MRAGRERNDGGDTGSAAAGTVDLEPALDRREPIRESDEAGPVGSRAADAVVAHFERQHPMLDVRGHLRALSRGQASCRTR